MDLNKYADSHLIKSQNKSELDELNTVELCSRHSKVNSNKPTSESPRDFIPQCHENEDEHKKRLWMSNNRSIQHIEEEFEEE